MEKRKCIQNKNIPGIYNFYCLISFVILLALASCKTHDRHTISCVYAACACGEDEPQFTMRAIDKDTSNLLSKELKVVFNSQKQDLEFNDKIGNCAICYNCYLTGELSYNSIGGYYTLELDSYEVKLRPGCCNQ
ncbi:hypothetical protein BH11BAC7_BH11BAC7_25300 [soil metagenome]